MTEQLLAEFAEDVTTWTLVPASGGVFEVTLDDALVFSKRAVGRHATIEELRAALQARVGQGGRTTT